MVHLSMTTVGEVVGNTCEIMTKGCNQLLLKLTFTSKTPQYGFFYLEKYRVVVLPKFLF